MDCYRTVDIRRGANALTPVRAVHDAVAGRHLGRARADSAAVTGGWSRGYTDSRTVGPRRE
jgi:hypothetical protein